MKRILASIVFIFLILMVVAAAERIWYMDSNNFKNQVNLGKTFYLPTYQKTWDDKTFGELGAGYSEGTLEDGTYSKINTLGNFGVFECEHRIKFFIQTDGRFVSMSDSTKYREFYVAFRPRVQVNVDVNYDRGSNGISVNSASRLPSTKEYGGYLEYTAPAVPAGGKSTAIDSKDPPTVATIKRFHADLIILMDELHAEDRQHLAESNDYIAEITLGWTCAEENCTNPAHTGSFRIVLHGYYGDTTTDISRVTMYVTPDPNSTNIDIRSVLQNEKTSGKSQITKISELKIYATSQLNQKWNEKIFTFLSASQDYYVSETSGFQLVNRKNTSITIPYTAYVYDTSEISSTSTPINSYDGKGVYVYKDFSKNRNPSPGALNDPINLTAYTSEIKNREGNPSYSVVFEGSVGIHLDMNYDDLFIIPDGGGDPVFNGAYSGLYTSNIYYHIVTNSNSSI